MVGVKIFRNCIWIALVVSTAILIFAGGCGKTGGFGFDVETDYLIDTLEVEPVVLVSGNSAIVTARVIGANERKPVKDVLVEFSTDTDTIENTRVITNDNGVAQTTFISFANENRRTATITAKVTAEQIRTKRRTIELLPTNYIDPAFIFLNAVPDTVYADGTSLVEITARVLDASYAPLEGHQVRFTFLSGNAAALAFEVDNYAITNADGRVNARFTAPVTSGVIELEAKVFGVGDTASARDTVWVLEIPSVDMIDLRADPNSITADGASELILSAYVTVGATSMPAPNGTRITFEAEDGVLLPYTSTKLIASGKGEIVKGSPLDRKRTTVVREAQTEGGYARVRLRSSTTAGRYRCKAFATNDSTLADSVYVRFTAGAPLNVEVIAGRSPINADGIDTTLIAAVVRDEFGNPVSAGWAVSFATDKGSVFPTSAVTDSVGRAVTVLTSGVISGYARVSAVCEGITGWTDVLFSSTIPKYINVRAVPNQITADGLSTSTITAEVLDSMFNPVTDGVRISFSSDSLGTLTGAKSLRGKSSYLRGMKDTRQALTAGGIAQVTLTAGTVAGACEIVAWFDTTVADTVADTVFVNLMPGEPRTIAVSFNKDSILADGEDTCQVYADVSDEFGNAVVSGYPVTFDPEEGSVNPISTFTNSSGRAETRLKSSRVVGWHDVMASTPGAIPGSGSIYFYPILPTSIRLVMEVDSAIANGADSVLISAYVTDDLDRPCSDGTIVRFRTTFGTFLPAAAKSSPFMANEFSIEGGKSFDSPRMRPKRDSISRETADMGRYLSPMADSFSVPTGPPYPAGVSRINLISPTTICTSWVYVSVATSDSTWADDSMKIVFVPDVPSRIFLTAVPDTIPADSASVSEITAYVTDAHSNPVGPGFLVEFAMSPGSEMFGTPTTLTDWTDDSSKSQTTFRSYYTIGEAVLNAKLSLFPSVSENVRIYLTGASAGDVVLSTDSTQIHIGSVMNIRANVYDAVGSPITDGTRVNFTVEPSGLATIVPANPTTVGGIANAEFRPGTSTGSCIVIATVGAVADTKAVNILPGDVASIILTSADDTLAADGVSTTSVTAQCFDVHGNRAEAGISVAFTTSLGSIISPTVTDSLGEARTTFTSGVTIGTARIQANAGSAPTATTEIELIGSEPKTMILIADRMSVPIGERVELTAYCLDGVGRPVSDGTRIDFSSALGSFTSIFEFTVGGFAYTTLISGEIAGMDTVIAKTITTTDTIADTLFIRYNAGAANYIVVTAADDTLAADPRARTTITAECTDAFGNALGAGRQVVFTSSHGTIISPVTTNSAGIATTEYTASSYVGSVRIDASLDLANGWTYIEQIITEAEFISVSATPNRVQAGGSDSTRIVATVLDASALPVPDGVVVNFSNTIGDTMSLPMTPFAITTGGNASIWWRSPNFTAQAKVYGSVFGLIDSATVDFIAGTPAAISIDSITPADTVFADGESRATIWARVFDDYGNPVRGIEVVFAASPLGTFVFDRGYTDSTGTVSVQIYSNESGNTTVMATAGGFTDYAELYFAPIVASEIFLSADDVRITADGVSTTTIRAIVLDSMGVGVPDNTPVRFSTDNGFIFPGVAYTTDGEATTILRSSTVVSISTITGFAGLDASGDSIVGTTQVEFVPGAPGIIEFTPRPFDIPADGDTFTPVRVIVYDTYGNHVRGGVRVSFTTTLGTIDSMNFTDTTGVTTVNLHAGTTPGTAIVWANSGEALAQTTVNFYSTFADNIILYVDPRDVVADGRSTASITGRVLDSFGMPVSDGSPVSFRVNPDSLGFITPSTAHTDSGDFSTTFNSRTVTGQAYIVAQATATVIDSVLIDLVPGTAERCSVWATPTSIPADSFSTSRCSVLVLDRFGHPVGAGRTVEFEVNRGTINPTSDITNSDGIVVAEFTAGRIPGEARVRATSGTAWGETYILLINADVRYVNLTIDDSEIIADGRSQTFARAMVTDSLGNPATNGTQVFFSIDTVAGSPDDTSLAYLSPSMGFTTAGEAVVQVFSRDTPGRVWIEACCVIDESTTICDNAFLDLVPGDVDSIAVVPEESLLPADGEAYTIVHAYLFDRYGNPLGSGISVQFTTSAGTVNPANTYTDGSGRASVVLTAGTVPAIARIEASSGGRVGIGEVIFEAAPPEYLSLRAEPRRIVADGESYSAITARVQNALGRPVRDGTPVYFYTDLGTIDEVATTVGGEASLRLYSATETGTATVTCSVSVSGEPPLTETTTVEFTPDEPFEVLVEVGLWNVDPGTGDSTFVLRDVMFADGSDTSIVRVSVLDRWGNPVESGSRMDLTVSPVPTLGAIIPSYGYTNINRPTTFRFLSGSSEGIAIITATVASGPVGTALVRMISNPVASISLYADSLTMTANGVNRSALTAIVLDSTGMAVADSTPIFFATTAGFVLPGVAYTSEGVAVSSLRSSTDLDTATVFAYVGPLADPDVSDTVEVRFVSGPPSNIEVIPNRDDIMADGEDTTGIWTNVFDAVGNRVSAGHMVRYTTTLGTIDTLAITGTVGDTSGVAISSLRSGVTPGTALVTATSGGAVGIGSVYFSPIEDLTDASIIVMVDPNTLTADGISTATVSGMVRNSAGNPISDGTRVRLFTELNTMGFVSPTIAYTDSGRFEATFTTSTYRGFCDIIAYVGDTTGIYIADTTRCYLNAGAPDSIAVVPESTWLPADSFSTTLCTVMVFDRFGNPVSGGVSVNVTTTLGEVFPTSDETNSDGIVIVTLRSGFITGSARVVARSGTARGEANVEFLSTDVVTVSLTVEDRIMQADGFSETLCRATILDDLGNPVSDGTPVVFSVSDEDLGSLIPQIAYTSTGIATTRFRVNTERGRVWIVARAGIDGVDSVFIDILPGNLASIELATEPPGDWLSANGRDNTIIVATLLDDFGNRLMSGNSVQFGTDLGSISPTNTFTNSNGDAFTTLTAGTDPGIARVWAQSGGVFELLEVEIRESNAATLLLSANPVQLVADGMSQSIITCQVFDTDGSPISDGTVVTFRAAMPTAGIVVSPKQTLGGSCVTTFTASTDVGAGDVWIIGMIIDTMTVPADTIADSVRIFLVPGPPAVVEVWADSDTIDADGRDNTNIYARVLDQYDNPMRAGQSVTFSTNRGTIEGSAITDTAGVARALLTADIRPGNAVIQAHCASAAGYHEVYMQETSVQSVVVFADSIEMRANGINRSKVDAHIFSAGGLPVSDGTRVDFWVESPDLANGYPEPAVGYTVDGIATINVRADTIAGLIRVYASAEDDTGLVSIRLVPGPASRLEAFSAGQIINGPTYIDTLWGDGSDNIAIACTVFDRYSNPITPGTAVTFTTTLGSILSPAFTNTSGYATTRLTAGNTPGDALVTVRCGDAIDFVQVRMEELVAHELVLNIIPARLPGNGTSTAEITAYVFDSLGMPVSDGTRVNFGHVNLSPNGIINPRVAFTSAGVATATLVAPLDVGTDSIVASVGTTVADTVAVVFEAGEPAIIEFDTASRDTLPADGSGWEQAAFVLDEFRNPVNIGTEVRWETTRGAVITPSVVEDPYGRARTYISSSETGPALLTARSGSAVGTKVIYFEEIEGNFIDVVANPIRIVANGVSTSNITVTVLDTFGTTRPVSDGTPVFFDVIGTGVINPRTAYTEGGQARATLTSGVITGMNQVVASVSATLRDTAEVEFIAGPPSVIEFDPIPHDMIADGADTQTVFVRVKDAYGNPVANGLVVNFAINKGFVTPITATGYNWPADTGLAFAVVVSGTESGVASLSAKCGSAENYAMIRFEPLLADSLILVVDPPMLVANGTETATLTAVVFDDEGLPVSDGTIVRFSTSSGIVNPAVAYTSGGIATSTLKSSTTPNDLVYVVADAGGSAIDTNEVRFIAGPPAVIEISADVTSIPANGVDSSMIAIRVLDQFGNSVGAGITVNITATLGTIVSTAYTDSTGRVSVRLTSGTASGFSNVRATSGTAEGNILIEFTSTEVGNISMTVIPRTLIANGTSTAEVTVVVLDIIGNPISDGTTVRFSGLSLGSITPIFATTTGGITNATIRSYTDTGTETLVAQSGDSTATFDVDFVSGPPSYIIISADSTVLYANESDTTRIRGQVLDVASNPVGAGHVVNFTLEPSGYGTIWAADVTDSSGQVDIPFRAGRFAGVVIIRATCEGATGITQIQLQPTDVDEIRLSVAERFLPADGVTSTRVSAFVTDSAGMQIANGTGVRFGQAIPPGDVSALLSPSFKTTVDGFAIVDLIAPTAVGSTYVYAYCDLPDGGVVESIDTIAVYFSPGNVAALRFDTLSGGIYTQIDYAQLTADGEDTLRGYVRVEDAFGNGIPEATVNLSMALGSVFPPIGITGPDGRVQFKITAPTRIGTTYLTATSGGRTGYLPVEFVPTPIANLTLAISPRGLPADGSSTAEVRAIATDAGGNPVSDGVSVRFTAQLGLITPIGYLEGGVATAVLVSSDTPGTDSVTVTCQDSMQWKYVIYDAGAPAAITINVSPDTATVGSTRNSNITGVVTDAAGNPVAQGTYVYISVDSVGMGSIADPVVATDSTGTYSTYYTPGLKAGLTGITARVDALSARKDILLYSGPPHTTDIEVSRDFIYVRGVGEIDQSVISAVMFDQYDNPVRDSIAVVFRIVDYPSGGVLNPELIPGSAITSDTVYSIGGRASATLRAGDRSGSVVVEMRAFLPGGGSFVSLAPRITVGGGLPRNVSVSVNKCNVRGWDVDGVPNPVMAIVTDEFLNPVAPGTAVWFTAEEGAITTSATTDDSGFAFATWFSSSPRNDGRVMIFAETRDTLGVRRDSVIFYSSGRPDSVYISVSPGWAYADTLGFADVRVDVWDLNDNPVKDSTAVQIITDIGSVESPVYTTNECHGSYATGRYTARSVFVDRYCDSDTGGVAKVTATVAGISESDTIFLKHDTPNSANSSISAPEEIAYGVTFPISVRVVDQWNNPICGEDVEVSGANITINAPTTQTTGSTGEAFFSVTAPPFGSASMGVIFARIVSTGGTFNAAVTFVERRRPSPPERTDLGSEWEAIVGEWSIETEK